MSYALQDHVTGLVDAELAMLRADDRAEAILSRDFKALRSTPEPVEVRFSGGAVQSCLRVTHSDGSYCVVYLPQIALFSLCVVTPFGPVDIGVHGRALDVFASV